MLTHHRVDGHNYPLNELISLSDILPKSLKLVDKITYKLFRIATSRAIDLLASYALEHKAQLLHFHYLVDARFFLSLKRKTCLPAVVSGYGYDVSSFPQSFLGYGKRYIRPIFDELEYFIAMSQDMRKDLISLGCHPEKIIVHYYGTDTRRFAYPERRYGNEEVITIFSCGTLEVKKAQHLVLKALRLMEQRHMVNSKFHVVFVGHGPMRSALEKQIVQYGWHDKVTFFGYVPYHGDRLVEAYRKADIFCLPSITADDGDKEGIPGTIVEAMASGLPVISTYHAGIPEIIDSGRNGILVREGDIEAMAQAFAKLINDPSLRERLGEAAAKRAASELNLQQGTAQLETIYGRILEIR